MTGVRRPRYEPHDNEYRPVVTSSPINRTHTDQHKMNAAQLRGTTVFSVQCSVSGVRCSVVALSGSPTYHRHPRERKRAAAAGLVVALVFVELVMLVLAAVRAHQRHHLAMQRWLLQAVRRLQQQQHLQQPTRNNDSCKEKPS